MEQIQLQIQTCADRPAKAHAVIDDLCHLKWNQETEKIGFQNSMKGKILVMEEFQFFQMCRNVIFWQIWKNFEFFHMTYVKKFEINLV